MTPDELHALLESNGVTQIKRRHHELMACCPNPEHPERKPSWGIRLDAPHLHGCFSCGFRGNLFTLLRLFGYSVKEAMRLAEMGEVTANDLPVLPELGSPNRPALVLDSRMLFPYAASPLAYWYLRRRGIPLDLARKAGVLYDRKENRVLFPWYLDGKLVGLTGRTLAEAPIKTLPYFGTKKSGSFYLPTGRINWQNLILVEGEIDALAVWRAGFPNVAALGYGTFSDHHRIIVLKSGASEVTCFFDPDKTGRRLTQEVCLALRDSMPVYAVPYRYEDYQAKRDPGDSTDLVIRIRLRTRKLLAFF